MSETENSGTRYWKLAGDWALIVFVYWLCVRLGLFMFIQPERFSPLWPASGLMLGIMLNRPRRHWAYLLSIMLAINTISNMGNGNSLLVSLGYGFSNTLLVGLGGALLAQLCGPRPTFDRIGSVLILMLAASLVNGVSSLLAAAISALAYQSPLWNAWAIWWAADGLGVLIVTPVVVGWANNQRLIPTGTALQLVETGLIIFVTFVFSFLLFGPWTQAEHPVLRNYMLYPLLFWAAFRLSTRGMANLLLLISIIAIGCTIQGYGIFSFANQTRVEHMVSLQVFLAVTAFSGLFISAIILERGRAQAGTEAANNALQAALARAEELAQIDPLTGIYNRRHLYDRAEHEIEVAARYQQPLAVVMFDIDHFKLVNDTFGHAAGDQLLKEMAVVVSAGLRSADVFGRYGGEEFVVVLPHTAVDQAFVLAERLRQAARNLRIQTAKGEASITLSMGIVGMRLDATPESAEEIFRRADEAMYAAKQSGRDRTVIL